MSEEMVISYLIINLIGFSILLIMALFMHKKTHHYGITEKIFFLLLLTNMTIIIFDSGMWVFDGKEGLVNRIFNNFFTALYYIFNPLICLNWLLYVDYMIYKDIKKLNKRMLYYSFSQVIITVLAILSIFTNVLFYIDKDNNYHHGKLFILFIILSYSYLVYASILLLKNKNKLKKRNFIFMLLYVVPPFVASIIQTLNQGINIIWVCTALSAVIVFCGLQSNYLNTDYLTGLYNRRHLTNYLSWRIKNKSTKTYLAGVMLDVDKFKEINDKYGHIEGDKALEIASKLLQESVEKKEFVARYAGDEFVILTESEDEFYIVSILDKLNQNVEEYNLRKTTPYNVRFSYGYLILKPREEITVKDFIDIIDKKMYEKKKEKAI